MRFAVLGSGSRGNSVFVESGATALLIDAGFSGKELARRLEMVGRRLEEVKALCITHEHNDHISGVGVVSRRLGVPVYANTGTLRAGEKKLGRLHKSCEFDTGECFAVGDLQVRSFRISHDTADPVGYVISDGHTSLGYLTDTGKTSHLMAQRLAGCEALILEFNHDLEMLRNGPYPLPLQQRVRSNLGHLCNEDAASFLQNLLAGRMHHLVLAHLSEKNNTPRLAEEAARAVVGTESGVNIVVAEQDRPLALVKL